MTDVGTLVATLVLDSTKYTRGINDATKQTQQASATMQSTADRGVTSLSNALNKAGASASTLVKTLEPMQAQLRQAGVTLAAFGASASAPLALAVNQAVAFESAFAGVRKTVDASEAEFAELNAAIRKMATDIPVAATELARIGELGGQLGISGTKDLTIFIDTIARLAQTTNLTAEAAATAFAQIANVVNMPAKDFGRLGSVVVDLGNKMAATETDITELMKRLAGAGNVVGLTVPQIAGLAAAIASVGIEAEMGGTAASKVLMMLSSAAASGGKELSALAGLVGMMPAEFAKLVQTDPAAAFVAFVQGLQSAQKEGKNLFGVLEELDIKEVRLRDTVLRLAGATNLLPQALATADAAWQQNTALMEESRKRFETTASTMGVMKNQLTELGIVVGTAFLPALQAASAGLGALIEVASNHPVLAQVAAAIAAIVGVGAIGGGGLLLLASTIPSAVAGFTLLTGAASAALVPLGALAAALGPITIAVAALGTAVVLIIADWDNFKRTLGEVGAALPSLATSFTKFTSELVAGAKAIATGVTQGLKDALAQVTAFVTTMRESGVKAMRAFADGILNAGAVVYNAVKDVFSKVTNLIPQSNAKEGPLSTLLESGIAFATTFAEGIINGTGEVVAAVTGMGEQVQSTLTSLQEPVQATITALFTGNLDEIEDIWVDFLGRLTSLILDWLSSEAVSGLTGLIGDLGGLISGGSGGGGSSGGSSSGLGTEDIGPIINGFTTIVGFFEETNTQTIQLSQSTQSLTNDVVALTDAYEDLGGAQAGATGPAPGSPTIGTELGFDAKAGLKSGIAASAVLGPGIGVTAGVIGGITVDGVSLGKAIANATLDAFDKIAGTSFGPSAQTANAAAAMNATVAMDGLAETLNGYSASATSLDSSVDQAAVASMNAATAQNGLAESLDSTSMSSDRAATASAQAAASVTGFSGDLSVMDASFVDATTAVSTTTESVEGFAASTTDATTAIDTTTTGVEGFTEAIDVMGIGIADATTASAAAATASAAAAEVAVAAAASASQSAKAASEAASNAGGGTGGFTGADANKGFGGSGTPGGAPNVGPDSPSFGGGGGSGGSGGSSGGGSSGGGAAPDPGGPGGLGGAEPFQHGGLVTHPTRALVGESFPEMVIGPPSRQEFAREFAAEIAAHMGGANDTALMLEQNLLLRRQNKLLESALRGSGRVAGAVV